MHTEMSKNGWSRARFGPYEVDLHTHELWKFGTRLKLVGQPFEILVLLLERRGELVTRDEMRSRLWPSDTFVDFNHGLNAAVNKLRDALSESADSPRYIETLPRRGYRFIAEVEWTPREPAGIVTRPLELVEAAVVEPVAKAEAAPVRTMSARPWRRRFGLGAVAAGVLLFGGAGLWVLVRQARLSANAMVQRTRPLLSVSNTSEPAFSPDGKFVAFVRNGENVSGIYVTRVGSDQLQRLTNNDDDCCPVWSPDGRWVAFSRYENKEHHIYLAAADVNREFTRTAGQSAGAQSAAFSEGGNSAVRRVDTGGVVPLRSEMDWSPNGRFIAFTGPSGIYVTSPDRSDVRRIVNTPPLADDWGPQFSPDGKLIMFVRNRQVGEPDETWVLPTDGGDAKLLFSERGRIGSPPVWSFDGRSVIYSSNRNGHSSLFRLSLDSPDVAVKIAEGGDAAWDPAVSRRGYRLAYERLLRSLSIWQLDLGDSEDKRPSLLVSSTSDTDQGPGPQFSPDGNKLAYMSDRNGTMEVWIANRDGTNPFQLTSVGGAGTPRWSPDSQAVVFDVQTANGMKVVSMNLHGGAPQVLADGMVPSWSRDGNWVYFAANSGERRQVFKVPAEGGQPVQMTHSGGHAALESLDGKYVYYSKTYMAEPEIWRVPVGGGEEVPMPLIHPGTWASWQVVEGGIVFVGPSLGHQAVLSFYDFNKNRTTALAVLDLVPFWLGATTDGKTVAFDQRGREQSQAMLVENFR